MAADIREPPTPPQTPPSDGAKPPQKLPRGLVLGKDGKPCRSCSSKAAFSQWANQTKSSLKSGAAAGTVGAIAAAATIPPTPATDCPADVETLGRATWTLLHSIAATYPVEPSSQQQSDLTTFMSTFSRLYPCWHCAEDFQKYMAKEQIRVGSRNDFGLWLCQAHNAVNRKLRKPEFDCSKWEERWRTGWKDGRCD